MAKGKAQWRVGKGDNSWSEGQNVQNVPQQNNSRTCQALPWRGR